MKGRFLEFFFADVAEAVCVACERRFKVSLYSLSARMLRICGEEWSIPVLKHRIFRWFPSSGLVRANTAGAKNMASSSGCAMRRQIRLFCSRGKDRMNGEELVDERVQKRKTAAMATTIAGQLKEGAMSICGVKKRGVELVDGRVC